MTSRTHKSGWLRYALIITTLVIIILLLRTCRNGHFSLTSIDRPTSFASDVVSYIPPTATFIAAFNLQSVLDDLDFNQLRYSDLYIDQLRQFYSNNPPFAEVFKDPESAGIKLKSKGAFYLDVGTKDNEVYTASILGLKDVSQFEKLIARLPLLQIEKKSNYQFVRINKLASVAWNAQVVIFLSTFENFDQYSILNNCFDLGVQKHLDNNQTFASHISQFQSDMAFWLDLTNYSKNQIHATGKPGEISSLLLRGNNIYGNTDFDKGTVQNTINLELNTVLRKVLDKAFDKEYDAEALSYSNLRAHSFLANLSLNIDGLLSFLTHDTETKIEARNSLVPYGLVLEDFGKALSGDVILATYPNQNSDKSSVLFGAKINDKAHFYNLLDIMQQVGQIEMISNDFYRINKGIIPFFPLLANYDDKFQRLLIKDDYAFVSLDKNIINGLIQDDYSNVALPIEQNNSTQNVSIYGNRTLSATKKYTNQFSIDNYNADFDGQQLHININLVDRTTSALRQLINQ